MLQDLRYGLRMLLKNRGMTAVAVLSLALGIGANTAIFSLVDRLLVRPLPVDEPERLVTLSKDVAPDLFNKFTYLDYVDYRDQNDVFDELVCFAEGAMNLSERGETERMDGLRVSANYFSAIGIAPALGRGFLPEEERAAGAAPVAVLSYGLWQRRFGGDPAVVGREITLNGQGCVVLGLGAAIAGTRVLTTFLYGVEAIDVVTFIGVAGLLGVVALLANYLPARRAARTDPIQALRAD